MVEGTARAKPRGRSMPVTNKEQWPEETEQGEKGRRRGGQEVMGWRVRIPKGPGGHCDAFVFSSLEVGRLWRIVSVPQAGIERGPR